MNNPLFIELTLSAYAGQPVWTPLATSATPLMGEVDVFSFAAPGDLRIRSGSGGGAGVSLPTNTLGQRSGCRLNGVDLRDVQVANFSALARTLTVIGNTRG